MQNHHFFNQKNEICSWTLYHKGQIHCVPFSCQWIHVDLPTHLIGLLRTKKHLRSDLNSWHLVPTCDAAGSPTPLWSGNRGSRNKLQNHASKPCTCICRILLLHIIDPLRILYFSQTMENARTLRKSGLWPRNIPDEDGSCIVLATRHASSLCRSASNLPRPSSLWSC